MSVNPMSLSLKGKRKKAVPKNANPLFTRWLTEWKNEASEKGWKSAHTYAKALKTLKLFPLPLETGKDCRLLQNFGDKICKMLDEKLAEYKCNQASQGLTGGQLLHPNSMSDSDSESSRGKNKATSQQIKHKKSSSKVASNENAIVGADMITTNPLHCETSSAHSSKRLFNRNSLPSHFAIHDISYCSSDSDLEVQPPQKFAKNEKSTKGQCKEYAPAYRSGSYALLLTLYRYMQNPNFKGFMTKAELSNAAQSLSEKSFTKPDPGSRYTAWSSMGTLIKRGFVEKSSNPARFSLTDAGYVLGERLDKAQNQTIETLKDAELKTQHESWASQKETSTEDGDLEKAMSESLLSYSNEISLRSAGLKNSFASMGHSDDNPGYSDDGVPISVKDQNKIYSLLKNLSSCATSVNTHDQGDVVCILSDDENDDISIISQASPKKVLRRLHLLSPSLSPSPKLRQALPPLDTSIPVANEPFVELHGNLNSLSSTPLVQTESEQCQMDILTIDNNAQKYVKYTTDSSEDELPDLDLPLYKRLLQKGNIISDLLKNTVSATMTSTSQTSSHIESSKKCTEIPRSLQQTYSGTSNSSTKMYSNGGCRDIISSDKIKANHPNVNHIKQNSQVSPAISSSVISPLTMVSAIPEFSFQPGSFDIILCVDNREFYGSKSNSKTLLPELMKNGIHCDLRLLHVGDLLWIARERTVADTDGKARELVLHYIIERKRMDDLVSSMVDGRMKEQKFRLKHCGLSETIILIEEYGSIQNFSISEDRIKQSIANSQIIDGFKVKHCRDTKDAVTYLVMMTQFLRRFYSKKTLHAVSLDHFKLLKGQQTLENEEHYLIPFDVFSEASVKNKDLNVRELFAKQLIQVPGVSADRARAITNVYPTFALLMAAYEKCNTDSDKEKLLAGIKCGKKERNLGIALSRIISMLYTQKGTLS